MDQKTLDPYGMEHPIDSESARHVQVAKSMQSRGERALLAKDLKRGLECFEAALKHDPMNAELYHSQGLALFELGNEEGQEKALLLASKKLKKAISLNPNDFDIWQAWGSILSTLGMQFEEHHYFSEAKEKFNQAIKFSTDQRADVLSELYWDLGIVYTHIAENSQEIDDLYQAMDSFQKANACEEQTSANFWSDFGYSCLKFAMQVNDTRFYAKAIQCFKRGLSFESNHFESWTLLGETLQHLYELTHDEEHFNQANECFNSASLIQPQDADLWIQWAKFLCDSSKRCNDPKRLRHSIEKCQRAFALNENDPTVQALWAESLALLGNYTERLDLIQEAQNKMTSAIEMESDSPEIWYSYGICMQTLGHYFNDYDYYYQAIEKFQIGLSIDRTCHKHWHAIGWTYSHIGDTLGDPESLDLSLRFFQKATDLNHSTYYLFDYAVALSKLGEMTHDQSRLEQSIVQFEKALLKQKNAIYLHPDWLFHYACTLDSLGDFHDEDTYYLKAVEIFNHVLMIDPDFTPVHHRLAIALGHLGEFSEEIEYFYRAIHHFRLSMKNDEENDVILLDWATNLINLAQYTHDSEEREQAFHDAEHKLMKALHLGNLHSLYLLACLNSLTGSYEKAMRFLVKAYRNDALPSLEEMFQDEWLDDLSGRPEFQEFIAKIEHKKHFQEER